MSIPKNRSDLVSLIESNAAQLWQALDRVGEEDALRLCVDDWSITDLLAVRLWWTERVVDWIEWGLKGESFDLPAPGYVWRETPRLNADIIAANTLPLPELYQRLKAGCERALQMINQLDDAALFRVGQFSWTGTLPLSRWIAINTSRQYETARTYIRRALKEPKT